MKHAEIRKGDPKAHPESQDRFDSAYCGVHCVTYDPADGCPYAPKGGAKKESAPKAKRSRKAKPKAS